MRIDSSRLRQWEQTVLKLKDVVPTGLPEKYVCYESVYVGYHSPRFAYLLEVLRSLGVDENSTVLDIGPTFSSFMIHEVFRCKVDTLSFDEDGATPFGQNYFFNLNDAQNPEQCRKDIPQYKVVVMAEVIEHCYTAPKLVLDWVRQTIAPGGHLILMTPNAVAFRKRVQMLMGKNPFELINEDVTNPFHFREYTLKEMATIVEEAGYTIELAELFNYFNPTYRQRNKNVKPWQGALYYRFNQILPKSMKQGMTIIATPKT